MLSNFVLLIRAFLSYLQMTSLMIVFLDLFLPDKPALLQVSTLCGPIVTSVSESIDDTVLSKCFFPQYQECQLTPNYFF